MEMLPDQERRERAKEYSEENLEARALPQRVSMTQHCIRNTYTDQLGGGRCREMLSDVLNEKSNDSSRVE